MSTLQIRLQPTTKQHQTWQKLRDDTTTEILFGGGAGGGKSRLGCEWLVQCCLLYPGSRWLLGRAVLKTLKQTTLLTFFEVAREWGLKQVKQNLASGTFKFDEQDGEITFWNGSVIHLKDLAYYPSDPDYASLGSTEYTGAFIDEVNQIRQKAKDIITVRLRYKLDAFEVVPKLFMSCNPAKNWVYHEFYKPWKDGKLESYRSFIQALAKDNPHNSPHYIDSLKRIKHKATKQRLYYGNWEYDDDPLALFQQDALSDMFTNRLPDAADRTGYISCDPARLGRDKCVIYVWKGLEVVHITAYDKSQMPKVEGEIERLRQAFGIGRSHVIVDEDGIGGGVVDHLPGVKGFIANTPPIQDEFKRQEAKAEGQKEYKINYASLKTQCYYELADRVANRQIAISCADPEQQQWITEDLEQVKGKDVDKDGKTKITSKEEMKESLPEGRSPDWGDALMMRMVFELQA